MAKHALLWGINAYPDSPLRGCVDDVTREKAFLATRFGFSGESIVTLLDGDATAQNQRDSLRRLVANANPGDSIELGNSSHGSTLVVRGKLVCCTCPVDFDFSPEKAITTDNYMDILSGLPEGVSFVWWSDSCHASLARGMNPGMPRSFPMPAAHIAAIQEAQKQGSEAKALYRAIPNHLHYPFVGGCHADQTSADAFLDGHYCGAFTHARLKVMGDSLGASLPMTEVVAAVHNWLHSNGYSQDPVLHGDAQYISKPWLWEG